MSGVDADFPCAGGSLRLAGPAGDIEIVTSCPPAGRARAGTAVICHPHPLYGGNLTNKVVHTLARSFDELGLRTLRFNFRGVGASAGQFDHGRGETDDLVAILDWVRVRRPGDQLWLAGFSFGAYVALRAAGQRPPARLVTVAPAVHLYDFNSLPRPDLPWLVVQGEADEVVSAAAVRAWAGAQRPPPAFVALPGVGHFFHQRLHDLRDAILDWTAADLPPAESGR